ncbi:carbohydrate sulfotransferase 11-like [Ruditapes philippinarum]|uniref:carbohydrate sulfotransferase 11-like n=1 Tax=Ruditapes philippinarum TaxID=129788 RepID=UPI00295B6CED|nr:carbohydrate sulfotransferase 11-like [Ruditapes philippinarum]
MRIVLRLKERMRRRYFIFSLGLALVILVYLNVRTTDELYCKEKFGVHSESSHINYSETSYVSGNLGERLFSERRQKIEERCDNISHIGKTTDFAIKSHLIIDKKYKLVYCFVEKNGCTFWKRVFQILNGFKNVSDPFDTQAMDAYGGNQTAENMPFDTIHKALISSTKFMFVRDPYERLLSGYVDKLFLPYAPYWFDLGRFIVDKFRRNSTSGALSCGDDVTFEEFIRYYIYSLKTGIRSDVHFSSNYKFCRPCEIKYDYVAKMENFKDETLFLLEKLNLSKTIKIKDFDSETERDGIFNAVDWGFHVDKNVDNCTTKDKALYKTYKKLQIRGIISKDIPYPFSNVSKIDIDEYKKSLLKANADPGPREKRKLNRNEAFLEAYNSLPRDLFQELQNILSVDAALFGYESNPEIFIYKSKPTKYQYFNTNRRK